MHAAPIYSTKDQTAPAWHSARTGEGGPPGAPGGWVHLFELEVKAETLLPGAGRWHWR